MGVYVAARIRPHRARMITPFLYISVLYSSFLNKPFTPVRFHKLTIPYLMAPAQLPDEISRFLLPIMHMIIINAVVETVIINLNILR